MAHRRGRPAIHFGDSNLSLTRERGGFPFPAFPGLHVEDPFHAGDDFTEKGAAAVPRAARELVAAINGQRPASSGGHPAKLPVVDGIPINPAMWQEEYLNTAPNRVGAAMSFVQPIPSNGAQQRQAANGTADSKPKLMLSVQFWTALASVHDMLNYGIAFLWLAAYWGLQEKLCFERSALGLSLQSLFALVFAEVNSFLLVLVATAEFGLNDTMVILISDFLTSYVSLSAYIMILRYHYASYEADRDLFGVRLLRIVCCCCKPPPACPSNYRNASRKQDSINFGFRRHWLALYIIAAGIAVPLQLLRRGTSPFWLGFWECFVDSVMAVALVPQLYMFWSKRPRRVSKLLGRFVVLLLFARLAALVYWLADPLFHYPSLPGRGVRIATELLNALILSDFTWRYFCSPAQGFLGVSLPI